MKKLLLTFIVVLIIPGSSIWSQAAAPAKPATPTIALTDKRSAGNAKFTWGGDIRLRSIYFDNIPLPMGIETRDGVNRFQRYRTRLWGEYQASENLKLYARLLNEFRTYQDPDNNSMNPLDEIVIDNLYLDWKISEDWSVRIGRQNLIYGTGKLIIDATPKDGSRTIYFDAIKATYTGFENTAIDVLGIYTHAKDPLVMHSEDRDLNGKIKAPYDGTESGGGIYLKNKSFKRLPFETYYLVKTHEQAWIGPVTKVRHDSADRHTVGIRLMPKFNRIFDGNFEAAYQFGDNIQAYMIDSLLNWHISDNYMKPVLGLGWYYLSGDDPSTSTDEGWNPLWARWPQYSELYVYAFDAEGAARWSNVNLPHVDFTFCPVKKLKTSLLVGYMFAPEADAVGGGHHRGLLATLWNRFTIRENLFSDGDKLFGHVLCEIMDPGNYYTDSQQNHTAFFGRIELSYSF